MKSSTMLTLVAALAGLVAGCDTKPVLQAKPELNDENCKPENILKIQDKDMRQEFSGQCSRRGSFKPSEPRNW